MLKALRVYHTLIIKPHGANSAILNCNPNAKKIAQSGHTEGRASQVNP